jgi:hypothetical protein
MNTTASALRLTDPAQVIDVPDLVVVAWRDAVVEQAPGSVATASEDALVWWTPSVGPTGMLLAHRLAFRAADGPVRLLVADLCAALGMGRAHGRLERTLGRLDRFGIVAWHGGTVAVRLALAPLTVRQRTALPPDLAASYRAHLEQANGGR